MKNPRRGLSLWRAESPSGVLCSTVAAFTGYREESEALRAGGLHGDRCCDGVLSTSQRWTPLIGQTARPCDFADVVSELPSNELGGTDVEHLPVAGDGTANGTRPQPRASTELRYAEAVTVSELFGRHLDFYFRCHHVTSPPKFR